MPLTATQLGLPYVDGNGLASENSAFGDRIVAQRHDLVSVAFVNNLPSQITSRIELWDKSGGAGTFTVNESVSGGTSGAVGIIETIVTPVRIRVVRGEFTSGETITGIGITATASGATCVITKNAAVNGTVTTASAVCLVTAGTLATCNVAIESKQYAGYNPGHELGSFFTAAFDAAGVSADSTQFLGLATRGGTGGYFIGYKGTSFGLHVRKNSVETAFIAQTAWNIDTLNGTGPSGLNMSSIAPNLNIYHLKTGYLGVYGAMLSIIGTNGRLYPLHFYTLVNAGTVTTVLDPHLTVRAEIVKTSGATTPQIRTASWNAYTVGPTHAGNAPQRNSGFVGPLVSVTSGAERFLFSITNSLTYAGVPNNIPVRITGISVAVDTSATHGAVIRFRRNSPTVGMTQVALDALNSSCYSSVTGTSGFSGGEVIFSAQCGYGAGTNYPPVPDGLWIMPGDSVTVTSESTSTQNTRVTITIEEGL